MKSQQNVAVVGGGVSGITAAYLLQNQHDVTLFEKNDYVGGHTHTVMIPHGEDAGTAVDTGFIVMNDRTYPLFTKLLTRLGVELSPTQMSFSYTCRKTGLQYASRNLNTLFAQRRNVIRPDFWRFLLGVHGLMKQIRMDLQKESGSGLSGMTVGQYLSKHKIDPMVVTCFILPMSAAIWSASDAEMSAFPMATFARFYENHGLLTVSGQPQWYVVKGGSHSYVKRFLDGFKGVVKTGALVSGIRRFGDGVEIQCNNASYTFDKVIVAAHADEAFAMLQDPSPEEKALLGPWRYSRNHVFLHDDTTFLPSEPRAGACWNYIREEGTDGAAPITVTYDMTRLQNLKSAKTWCVTLNPGRPIDSSSIVKEIVYHHPLFTFDSVATQEGLQRLNGANNTWYCGSYFGYGFHEDAVASAVSVARFLGGEL